MAPRLSSWRKWGMSLLFLLLCSMIGGYLYLTDASRVRAMAESYLTRLIGGHVKVESASLSIFEGLRLNDVKVYVDRGKAPDSILFSADTFLIKYDPRVLLTGRLEADQIVAIAPHVWLTENVDTGKWNYHRLVREPRPATDKSKTPKPLTLPEVVLRNGQVDYSEIRDGEQKPLGSLAMEGQLTPSSDGERYLFELQSRGSSEGVGPVVTGSFSRTNGQISARLERFEFGQDVRSMLPAEVRNWWEAHQLTGRVNVPVLSYMPAKRGKPAAFKVETELNGVTLLVRPEEWMGRDELRRRESVRWVYETARALSGGVVGFRVSGFGSRELASTGIPKPEIRNPLLLDRMAWLFDLSPIRLNRVSGRFVFVKDGVNDGVEVHDVGGRIENNAFVINGKIKGFSPHSPASLTIASLQSEHLYLPPAPRYVRSLPRQVRQIYNHLKPQGTCDLVLRLNRQTWGGRPQVSGEVSIVDGSFVFDRFPYPLRKATGRIEFYYDQQLDQDVLEIVNLSGVGIDGGPNADSTISINGRIAPLTSESGVNIRIASRKVTSEPALAAAFPEDVRKSLQIFDPQGQGEYPKYSGGFECEVIRSEGKNQRWTVNVDIRLDDASGALTAFPYPLRNVSGTVQIRDGFVDIRDIRMQRGQSTLTVNGRVSWDRRDENGRTIVEPSLQLQARSVPIDDDLFNALPEERRRWLKSIGLGGAIDVDGRVFRGSDRGEMDHDLLITLRGGKAWPAEAGHAVTDVAGQMRLTADRLVLSELRGRRGDAELHARGAVSWQDGKPQIALSGGATNLALDSSLYTLLPAPAQRAWDQVNPEGTIDLDISYTGAAAATSPGEPPSNPAAGLELTIRPRKLSATVKAVPYRVDDISGSVSFADGAVTLRDLIGKHGESTIRVSGAGTFKQQQSWALKLGIDRITIDDEFREAMPEAIASLMESLKLQGQASIDFPRLDVTYRNVAAGATQTTQSTPSTTQPDPNLDVDFAAAISTSKSALDLGMPLTDVDAKVKLAGTVRQGRLWQLSGAIESDALTIAGRTGSNFSTDLSKAADSDVLKIGPMRGKLADGELAGQVEIAMPRDGPSKYDIDLILRNADVRQLAPDGERDVTGRLTASLAIEGNWADPSARRGRGDVSVSGQEMYKIPLILGLLQVTNLSLPISSPFNEASAAYSVDGQRVTFESIALRSRDMLMHGSGHLDFGTKVVRLRFTTDNPNWPKVPIIGDIMESARHELLQIQVRGTLQEPKVSASTINTFTTTVDEVLRGDGGQ